MQRAGMRGCRLQRALYDSSFTPYDGVEGMLHDSQSAGDTAKSSRSTESMLHRTRDVKGALPGRSSRHLRGGLRRGMTGRHVRVRERARAYIYRHRRTLTIAGRHAPLLDKDTSESVSHENGRLAPPASGGER